MRTSTWIGLLLAEAPHLALLDARAAAWPGTTGVRLGDLVEEERAAVGFLEQALARADGAGERAARVAEQLALEQRLADRRAVDGHERARRALAVGVHRARDQLLAGAALARDQHGRVGRRDA